MATFIKRKLIHVDGPEAEDLVQEALEGLGKDWIVFWQYRFENLQSRRTRFCEIDFVVWNREYGVFVLEVKGGMWKFENGHSLALRDQQWLADFPFEQALDNSMGLLRALKSSYRNLKFGESQFHTIVLMPDVVISGSLPPGVSESQLVDRRGLPYLEEILRNRASGSSASKLTEGQCDRLKEYFSASPQVSTVDDAAWRGLTQEQRRLERTILAGFNGQLSRNQNLVLEDLNEQHRVVVLGSAGTGKSLIALLYAIERSRMDASFASILICHRISVRRMLLDLFSQQPDASSLRVKIESWSTLVEENGEGESVDPSSSILRFEEQFGPFNAVVVDEAQEFSEDQMLQLELLCEMPGVSQYLLFADPFQASGYLTSGEADEAWKPPFKAELLYLDSNWRNATSIAEFAFRYYPLPQPGFALESPGDTAVIESSDVVKSMLLETDRLQAEGFPLASILAVFVGCPQNISFDYRDRFQSKFRTRPYGVGERTPKSQIVPRFGMARQVQGLESEAVVMGVFCSLDASTLSRDDRRDLYVGASRAKAVLRVVHQA
jgi:Nuclease-related domain/PhoH-like protein